jgi:hypothetical protein
MLVIHEDRFESLFTKGIVSKVSRDNKKEKVLFNEKQFRNAK